jgi:hypothetical protein
MTGALLKANTSASAPSDNCDIDQNAIGIQSRQHRLARRRQAAVAHSAFASRDRRAAGIGQPIMPRMHKAKNPHPALGPHINIGRTRHKSPAIDHAFHHRKSARSTKADKIGRSQRDGCLLGVQVGQRMDGAILFVGNRAGFSYKFRTIALLRGKDRQRRPAQPALLRQFQRDLTFASAMRRIKTVRYVTVCVKRRAAACTLSAFASACTGAVQTAAISAARQSGDRKTVLVMAQELLFTRQAITSLGPRVL